MIKSFFSYFLIAPVVLILAGCDGSGGQHEAIDPVLSNPIFKGINDSIRKFPNDPELYLRRAKMLSLNNAHEIANADYRKSWDLQPTKETGLLFASNLSILDKPDERTEFLKLAEKKFPGDPEFNRLLGESYIESGDDKAALEIYDNLLKKDSLDFESWYEKGRVLAQLKDTASAIAALKKAYSLQPVNTYALELAHLYAEMKNPIALRICDEVDAGDSAKEMVDPFFIKGIYYSNTKQYKQAIIAFDSCIRRDWKFADAYIEKGIAFFKQQNYDEALNTFRLAATVSNIDPDAYFWIGRCYEAVNKKEEALTYYERALALDRNFVEAREAIKRLKG
ncbi:MAG: hypothetical protein C5B59_19025 [Bacteroidetes bacterium]|nr:MAG: hypothetical protein C5B59_19025 [Bacteroidota bacterium]